jgi:4-hydroxy-tetrahydrodipicolinate reductase
MIKVVIVGAAGRMGRQLLSDILRDDELSVVGGVVEPGQAEVGADLGVLGGQQAIGIVAVDSFEQAIDNADVIIEFTAPGPSVEHAELAARRGKAMVIGTTGLSPAQIEQVRQASQSVPIFQAPNMSVGVNVLFKALPIIVQALGTGYDIEIVGAHHRMKKDAPSGTALKLAEVIAEALDKSIEDVGSYGRKGIAPRVDGEIGIHAVRAGGIVGDHTVLFANEAEQIEVVHRAFSRQNFSLGALRAAKFIARQKPGFYSMQDVL